MKKILFMVINLNIGGTEKALLSLIKQLKKDGFEITVLMLEKKGGFIDQLPEEVRILELEKYHSIKKDINLPPAALFFSYLKKARIIKAILSLLFWINYKFSKDRRPHYRYLTKGFEKLEEEYDIAVAYAGPMDFISYYVAEKVKSDSKIQWIHFDVSKIGFNKEFAKKLYQAFNKIFVVSEQGLKNLVEQIPELSNKAEVFLNMVSRDEVMKGALMGKGFGDDFQGKRILTVGRLSYEKGQDMALKAVAMLKKQGYKFKWYFVGKGSFFDKLQQLSNDLNINDYCCFLGETNNPYKYMEQCDIYVQPSRHEGYCITLQEAMCFGVPVVATDFTGAREQIINGKTGHIVDISEKGIFSGVKALLNNEN